MANKLVCRSTSFVYPAVYFCLVQLEFLGYACCQDRLLRERFVVNKTTNLEGAQYFHRSRQADKLCQAVFL